MAERIGLFGGTFNPPHFGHLIIAARVHEALGLDRLLLVPAAEPPLKSGVDTAAGTRSAMLKLAVAGDQRFAVDETEIRRGGTSYTVDTLREIRQREPGAELFLVIGADQYAQFGSWKEPEAILELATLGVVARAGETPGADASYQAVKIDAPRVDISSTEIRQRVADGRSIRYFVPESVRDFILRHQLYQDG